MCSCSYTSFCFHISMPLQKIENTEKASDLEQYKRSIFLHLGSVQSKRRKPPDSSDSAFLVYFPRRLAALFVYLFWERGITSHFSERLFNLARRRLRFFLQVVKLSDYLKKRVFCSSCSHLRVSRKNYPEKEAQLYKKTVLICFIG